MELGTLKWPQEAYVTSLKSGCDVKSTSGTPASHGGGIRPRQADELIGDWPVRDAVGSLLWAADHVSARHGERRASCGTLRPYPDRKTLESDWHNFNKESLLGRGRVLGLKCSLMHTTPTRQVIGVLCPA